MDKKQTMIILHFPNVEIAYCHLWNIVDLNNALINN